MQNEKEVLTAQQIEKLNEARKSDKTIMIRSADEVNNQTINATNKTDIERWAYKHPSPDDFFRTMESEAGEDLSWFWKEWFCNNWQFDAAVESVSYTNDDAKNGADITIINLQKMALPLTVEIVLKDGSKMNMQLPFETWMQSAEHSFHVQTTQAIQSVTIDPENKLPDSNRSNNVWKP